MALREVRQVCFCTLFWLHSALLIANATVLHKATSVGMSLVGFRGDAWTAGGSSICSSSVPVPKPFLLPMCRLVHLIPLLVMMQDVTLAL